MAPTSQSGKASLNSPSSASSTRRPPSARDKRVRSTRYAAGITIIASVPSTFSITVLANSCRLMCAADAVSCAVTVRSCVTVEYDECCWSRKLCRRGDSMVASASAPADRPLAGGAVWWTARASCIAHHAAELTLVAIRRRDCPPARVLQARASVPLREFRRVQPTRFEHRRARAVGLHLHLAAGVAVEVALFEHEVAALPPGWMVAEDQTHGVLGAGAVGVEAILGIHRGGDLHAAALHRLLLVGPQRGHAALVVGLGDLRAHFLQPSIDALGGGRLRMFHLQLVAVTACELPILALRRVVELLAERFGGLVGLHLLRGGGARGGLRIFLRAARHEREGAGGGERGGAKLHHCMRHHGRPRWISISMAAATSTGRSISDMWPQSSSSTVDACGMRAAYSAAALGSITAS